MKKNVMVRIVAVILAILMVATILVGVLSSSRAYAVSQSDIDDLQDQQADIQSQESDLQTQIDGLTTDQTTAMAKKQLLDEKISLTQEQIDNLNTQIDTYTQLIAQKNTEVQAAEAAEQAQLEKYKDYIRLMEENGDISYFEILFSATSFSDLLDRIDMVSEVMTYEDQMYKDIGTAKQNTINAKADLESSKTQMEQATADLQATQADLQSQVDDASALIAQIDSDITTKQAAQDALQADEDNVAQQIEDAQAELEAQKAAAEAAAAAAAAAQSSSNSSSSSPSSSGGSVTGTGSFIWPCGCTLVTSSYGYRWHPISGEYAFHSGVDIGASYGSSVYAADSGTVTISGYSSGYGNYIAIYHGNGVTTLYAHCSQLLVSVGDTVSQGEVIAYSGSSGYSTGPHLHFEVRIDGSTVDPLQYFSNYTLDE